jgi:hypothetical protein
VVVVSGGPHEEHVARSSGVLAQVATIRSKARPPRRAGQGSQRGRSGTRNGGASPRLHLGRLAVLALVLIGASFYVAPLRQFFAQQDRYHHAAASLTAARADNASYKLQVRELSTKSYVAQRARTDSMLVPPNTQVFVIKGLPGRDPGTVSAGATSPTESSFSVIDRLADLWRTLLH